MARRLVVMCVCVAGALASPQAAPAAVTCGVAEWPQFERSSSHAGEALPGTRVGTSTLGTLRRAWRASIGHGNTGAVDVASSPLEACGAVFVASADGRVYAFDASSGRRLWRTVAVAGSFWGAAIGHGTLFTVGSDGRVYAYATRTGRLLWSQTVSKFRGGATTAPLVVGSTVYVMSASEMLVALDATSGSVRWSAIVGGSFLSAPAAANGLIYVGVENRLAAIDAASGSVRWSGATGDGVWSTPTVHDGSVYVGSNDHRVYAFDAASGTPRWSAPTGDRVYTSAPVAVGTDVYVGSLDRQLHAFDAATGAARWSFLTGAEVTGSPAVAGGVVFIGSLDGTFYAVDAATGSALWSDAIGQPIGSSPAIGARNVYVTTATALVAYRVS